jgi:hypothetical protein
MRRPFLHASRAAFKGLGGSPKMRRMVIVCEARKRRGNCGTAAAAPGSIRNDE